MLGPVHNLNGVRPSVSLANPDAVLPCRNGHLLDPHRHSQPALFAHLRNQAAEGRSADLPAHLLLPDGRGRGQPQPSRPQGALGHLLAGLRRLRERVQSVSGRAPLYAVYRASWRVHYQELQSR